MQMTSDLMPAGKADLLGVIQFPMIKLLVEEHGKKNIFKALFLLVKDFCKSLNVVRNMNEDQMLEAANMLIEECGNFRMEDYLMMFQMAKKGQLIKIYDRIDIEVVTAILDKYWEVRLKAGREASEQESLILDKMGNTDRIIEKYHPQDAKLITMAEGLAASMESVKSLRDEKKLTYTPNDEKRFVAEVEKNKGINEKIIAERQAKLKPYETTDANK